MMYLSHRLVWWKGSRLRGSRISHKREYYRFCCAWWRRGMGGLHWIQWMGVWFENPPHSHYQLQPQYLLHLFPQRICGKHWTEIGFSLGTFQRNQPCSGWRHRSSPCCLGLTWDHKTLPAWTWEGAASHHTSPSCLHWSTHSAFHRWRPFPAAGVE